MRRHDPFDRKSLAASIGVHVGVLLLSVVSSLSARPPLEFVSYQIELVSPPPAVQEEEAAPATEELVVERPDPAPAEPEEEDPIPVETEKKPPPKPPEAEQPPRQDPAEKPAEQNTTPVTDAPVEDEEPEESGEGINVRLEGVRRDYPAYYDNIIRQIQRCFRWRGQGSWETTVFFVIGRDGMVSEREFVKRSGNPTFDFEALGAVDCAGKGRFGALPEDLPYDGLPIQFNFRPQGGIRNDGGGELN